MIVEDMEAMMTTQIEVRMVIMEVKMEKMHRASMGKELLVEEKKEVAKDISDDKKINND